MNSVAKAVEGARRRPLTAADVMNASEVALLMGVPESTVEDWARRGIVPSRKVGRRRLYVRVQIEGALFWVSKVPHLLALLGVSVLSDPMQRCC